ncbi:hypothetical protein THOM_2645, partial [Trachipleistophora hominis]
VIQVALEHLNDWFISSPIVVQLAFHFRKVRVLNFAAHMATQSMQSS